ncbi:MAG TPA: anti-sigma factor [Rhodanobacteraceae bacterium]
MSDMHDVDSTGPFPSEVQLHAYVDGQLGDADRVRLERWLDRHPIRAKEIRGWQRDAQQLRAAYGDFPGSARHRTLDPMAIRVRRANRRRAHLATAAVLVLALGIGATGGWQARSLTTPAIAAPMADALQAYRMFATDRHLRLDMTQHKPGQLQAWLGKHFPHAPPLPRLNGAGFHPVGARLVATDSGPAAMVLYENLQGGAISFYIRPPAPGKGGLPHGQRRDGQLVATYWSGNGYNYALVSPATAADLRTIHAAAFSPAT